MRFNYLHACRLRASHSGSFTVVPQKLIIYMCGASQTPSLHVVVSLGLL